MSFFLTNLFYFLIVPPPIFILFYCINRFIKKDSHIQRILSISIALFYARIMLVLFADSIGVMPHVQPELIFYSLLTVFGVAFTICAVKFVEKQALTTFGWHLSNLKKNILIGILGIIPLLAFLPVIYFTTNFTISSEFTLEKLILASTFGLILGGFYEEVMFRGIIQYHVGQITTKNRTIIYTAIIFVLTHVGYLPFDAYGIYYWFLFLMALELSYIRSKYNSISCAILHGGIVFVLILLA